MADYYDPSISNLQDDPATLASQGFRVFSQQPKFMPVGSAAGEMTQFMHSPATQAAKTAIQAEGFQDLRPNRKIAATTDDLVRWGKNILRGQLGEGLFPKAEGVFGAIGDKASDAYNTAKKFGTDKWFRGLATAKNYVEPFATEIPSNLIQRSRSMLGQLQGRVSADVANKYLNLGNKATGILKALPPSLLTKLMRASPGVGAGLGYYDAQKRFSQGDVLGGWLSAGSMYPGWGMIPLGAQIGTDYLGITGGDQDTATGGRNVVTGGGGDGRNVVVNRPSGDGGRREAIAGGAAGASAPSRPSGYAAVRKYGRYRGGLMGYNRGGIASL